MHYTVGSQSGGADSPVSKAFSQTRESRANLLAKFSPIWWLPEGLVSVLPNLDIRQGVIAGRAARLYRPTDVWGKPLLVEAYKGPSNDPRKVGMKLFVAMYMWELKKPQTGPHTMHFYEKPEKTKACTSN